MRVSIIVAIYKDLEALKLIVGVLKKQNYKDFELVVAEDNDAPSIASYLQSVEGIDIVHTSQEDNGIQKARSQNNAILNSTGDYLIFIDGDCIPYSNFISSHVALSEKGSVLSGRRVNLGPRISRLIRKGYIDAATLQNHYWLFFPILLADHASHVGQGVSLSPQGWIYRNHISKRKKSNLSILGCNFSCFKEDFLAINGFDESYGESAIPDDTDIQWRFEAFGLKLKPCKLSANIFHLYHERGHRIRSTEDQILRMQNKKSCGDYIASTGLSMHDKNQVTSTGEKTSAMNSPESIPATKAHFLHIGKTGGTAIKYALDKIPYTGTYKIKTHPHITKFSDIPKGEKIIFFLRDPISRFISSFYSRKRKGQPRYNSKWSDIEEISFSLFNTPNELALSLSNVDDSNHAEAIRAMKSIQHINSHFYDWLISPEYFESRIDDVLFVGFQESLNQDFTSLKNILDLPEEAVLPCNDIEAHRNPEVINKDIDKPAVDALKDWYKDDFDFIKRCKHFTVQN